MTVNTLLIDKGDVYSAVLLNAGKQYIATYKG